MRVAWCPVILLDDGVYDFPERCSGAEYKDQVMGKLLALAWPKRFFLQFLKTFRDFSMSDEHERDVCAKLYREANGEINVHSPDDRANNFELLPTVFHNVLLLALRTKNEVCKRLLIHLLMQQCALLTREGSTPSDYVQERSSSLSRTHSVREIRGLQATILYHLDIVIKQDPSMVKIFLVEYEAQSESLTPFDVAVMLTISSAPQGARVSGLLCHQIVRSYLREVVEGKLIGNQVVHEWRSYLLVADSYFRFFGRVLSERLFASDSTRYGWELERYSAPDGQFWISADTVARQESRGVA